MQQPTDKWSATVDHPDGTIGSVTITHAAGKDADVMATLDIIQCEDSDILDLVTTNPSGSTKEVLLNRDRLQGPVLVKFENAEFFMQEYLYGGERDRVIGEAVEYSISRDLEGSMEFLDAISAELDKMAEVTAQPL